MHASRRNERDHLYRDNGYRAEDLMQMGIPEYEAASLAARISRNIAKPPVNPAVLTDLFPILKTCEFRSARETIDSALEAMFSHVETLQCSFQLESQNKEEMPSDNDRIVAFYRSALAVGDTELTASLHQHVRYLLHQLGSYRGRVPVTRAFMILLFFPVVVGHMSPDIVSDLLHVIDGLDEPRRFDLFQHFGELSAEHMTSLVQMLQSYLTAAVNHASSPHAQHIRKIAELLAMLFEANQNVKMVPHVIFYNDAVNSGKFDIELDFSRWIDEDEPMSFSFCNFPFVYDSGSKSRIMQLENSMAQDYAFEGAFWRALHISEETDESFCPFLLLRVRRGQYLLQDTIDHIQVAKERHLLKCPLKVQFEGEDGIDEGGLTKEFFQLLLRQLFDVSYGMFTHDEQSHLWWFRSSSAMNLDREFELAGTLLGLAIFNSHILDLHFPHVVYKKLLGHPLDVDDLEEVYPEIYRSLKWLLSMESGVTGLGLYFVVDHDDGLGGHKSIDLISDGSRVKVTKHNRYQFVRLYTRFLLETSIEQQFDAFRTGFLNICLSQSLQLFLPSELEQAVCGRKEIDLESLEEHAVYAEGYRRSTRLIRWFWSFAHELDDERKRKLLSFVTGSDRVPIRGFADLLPRFTIARSGPHAQRLPTAHTCFNLLLLPEYTSKEVLVKQMNTAIENSEGFGLV